MNFDESWNLPFEFGAVPNIWVETLDSRQEFSSLSPTGIFEDMVSKLETTDFRLKNAEQSYLNHYSASFRLLWEPCDRGAVAGGVEGDAVGYKARPSYRRQALRLGNEVPERDVRLDAGIQRQETGGHFAPELAWWEELFYPVMGEIGNFVSPACNSTVVSWEWITLLPRRWII